MFFFASLPPLLAGSYFLACLPSAGASQFIDHDSTSLLAAISGADKVLRRANAPPPALGAQPVQPQAPAQQAPPAAQPQPVAPPQAPALQALPAQAQAGAPLQAPAQQIIPAVQPQAGAPLQAPAQPGIAPIINLPAAQFAGPEIGDENNLEGPNCIRCLLDNMLDCTSCATINCTACVLIAACGWLEPASIRQECSVMRDDCEGCMGRCLESCRRPQIEPLPVWWKA